MARKPSSSTVRAISSPSNEREMRIAISRWRKPVGGQQERAVPEGVDGGAGNLVARDRFGVVRRQHVAIAQGEAQQTDEQNGHPWDGSESETLAEGEALLVSVHRVEFIRR